MKRLYVMCGPAACGKSTWCQKQIAQNGGVWISRDLIRFSFLKEGDNIFSHEKEALTKFYQLIEEALDSEQMSDNIYVDATFLTPKVRRKVLHLARKRENVEAIAVDCGSLLPIELAIARNSSRTGHAFVPEQEIRNMYERYVTPSKEEGFDKIIKGEL